jgi:hypothetical protein
MSAHLLQQIALTLASEGRNDLATSILKASAEVNGLSHAEKIIDRDTGDSLQHHVEFNVDYENYEVSIKKGSELQTLPVSGPVSHFFYFHCTQCERVDIECSASLVKVENDQATYRIDVLSMEFDDDKSEHHFDARDFMPAGSFAIAR